MVLILDNYDSFTYNLYQIAGTFKSDILVKYSDQIQIAEIEALTPSHIIISSGPERPEDTGICNEAILHFAKKIPILGIGHGHQTICEAFGAKRTYTKIIMHMAKNTIHIANGNSIFRGLPPIIEAGQYHSLIVERSSLPDELLIIAETKDGEAMGIKHHDYNIFGLQFHPESILTQNGEKIIENFLKIGDNSND